MYFYVMESPATTRVRRIEEQILTTLRGYGVSGEVVLANPARPAQELARLGLSKGYATIVAIGGERVITGVLNAVQGTSAAMGVVPIDAHPRIAELTGIDSPESGCEALRHRKLSTVDITFIDPGKHFLTEARIEVPGELPVRVHVDDVVLETQVTRLSIFGNGEIELVNDRLGRSPLREAFDWLTSKPKPPANITRMRGNYLKVETNRSLPVRVGPDIIARTPFVAAVKPRALKLIVKRGILRGDESA